MALLLSCQEVTKQFGAKPLFTGISFGISDRERVGLIGPNGAGKSTLMRILAGQMPPDEGTVAPRKLLRLGYVEQLWEPPGATVGEVVSQIQLGEHLSDSERLARENEVLGKTGFYDRTQATAALSGGWRKRLAIAVEMIKDPELLLLDEPTNHLDLEGILWLEKLLTSAPFASLVISHDRYFLENVATRMLEINRMYPEGIFGVNGNYSEFLTKRAEYQVAQAKYQESLENKVRREVEWLRRGPKARTTKAKARIDSAGRLIDELADTTSRNVQRTTQIDFAASDRRTKRLVEATKISKSLGGRELFRDLSFVLAPGTRLGLLGPNGSGKSTLLRIITGESEPDEGQIRRADFLRVVYFDQNREQLDPAIPLRRALAPEGDSVIFRDRPIHVAGWATRFLFRAEQLDMAVGRLSGGEQARVAIARLMLQPADVLLLDEPTNDLDIATLEVLEENLLDFSGALVIVSHDRYLLDRVATQILGLDGTGNAQLYADTEQWEQDVMRMRAEAKKPKLTTEPVKPAPAKSTPRKLSYMETREWDQIEARIQEAESKLAAAHAEMQNPEGAGNTAVMQSRYQSMVDAQAEVDRLYERWAELEAKLAG